MASTQVVPAADSATEKSWIEQLGDASRQLTAGWVTCESEHDILLMLRAEWGQPPYDEKWTESNEENFARLRYAITKIAEYVDEVERRVRNVAYDPSIDSVVALATVGEPQFSYKDGVLTITVGGTEDVKVDFAGFVGGAPPVPWQAVVGVAVAAAVIVAVYYASQSLVEYIRAARESDREKRTKDLLKEGKTPEEVEKILKAEADAATAQDEAKRKLALASEANQMWKTIRWVTVSSAIVVGLGVAGYAMYKFWPEGGGRRMLAAHNPAGDPSPMGGYAYVLVGRRFNWKTAPDDYWDTEVISESDGPFLYAGKRFIDGTPMFVWKAKGLDAWVAQTHID